MRLPRYPWSLCVFILSTIFLAAGASATSFHHPPALKLNHLGTYASGVFDESAAEIAAYDKWNSRVFITNSFQNSIDIIDIVNPYRPSLAFSISLAPYGAGPNSVAISKRGVVAVAVESDPKTSPGKVVFFTLSGQYLNELTVGSLPDMLTFTPNGKWLLVANEGEPNDEYTIDPEGSVSIIPIHGGWRGIRKLQQNDVREVGFQSITMDDLDPRIRIFGPDASIAQDLEPEYIAVSKDSRTAYVALQENNGLAVIDIENGTIKAIHGLGTKDHRLFPIDASNKDDAINIQKWPVSGMYQPDAIGSYRAFGHTFIVTTNEGDSRDYDGYSEEARVKDLVLDPTIFPDADELQKDENLGRLKITTAQGDNDNDDDYDQLYSYGGRSFSIWSENGYLIYDSGSEFERLTAEILPNDFNSTNDENDSFDNRSDDKGVEPEALAIGKIAGRKYAFIGLERLGGIMVYDITNPFKVSFVTYYNNRDFAGDAEAGTAGDLGPESIVFVPGHLSPTHTPLLVVANEVSGTTTILGISFDKHSSMK